MSPPEKNIPASPLAGIGPRDPAEPKRRYRRGLLIGGIALGLYLCFVAIIVLGRPGLGLRAGDVATRDYVARVEFETVDLTYMNYLREVAKNKTPEVYLSDANGRERLKVIAGNLAGILDAVYENGRAAPELADLKDDEKERLIYYVQRLHGPEVKWSDVAAEMLNPGDVHLLDPQDYSRVEAELREITVAGAAKTLPLSSVVNISRLGDYISSQISDYLSRKDPAIGKETAAKLAAILADILKRKEYAIPTLRYSEADTQRARQKAADAVLDKTIVVPAGKVILRRGQEAEKSHLRMLKDESRAYYERGISFEMRARNIAGTALVLLVIFGIGGVYLVRYQPRLLKSEMRFFILGVLLVVVLGVAKIVALRGWQLYLIPISFVSMVLAIAYDARISISITWILAAVIAFMVGAHGDLWSGETGGVDLLIYLMAGAAVAAWGSTKIRRRSKLIKVGFYTGLAYALVVWGTGLITGATLDAMIINSLLGLGNGLTVGFLISGVLPFIEHWFNIVTDISLLELSDQNHPLLKRLIFDAPGTYHHSLIVGNLAEEAAASIGANALMARVGSYFHDIGKLKRPEYFIENEAVPGTKHSRLTTPMSTAIILAHTRDGVELAQQYDLPNKIKSLIQRHHGTSILEYFYNEALREYGGEGQVDEASFRYSGPKPDTKEGGIVLLADACEAASRTLVNPSVGKLQGLVEEIISKKISDGQLDESGLTLTDLARCKESFVRVLMSRFHTRVKYPETPAARKKEQDRLQKQETVFYTRRRPES